MSETSWKEGLPRILEQLRGLALALLAILLLAGIPLVITSLEGRPRFTPERLLTAFVDWLRGLGDGSSFVYRYAQSNWNLLDQAPSYLLVSFINLALPGTLALFLGSAAALILDAGRRETAGRLLGLLSSTPDFLLALGLQALAVFLAVRGLPIRIGPGFLGTSLLGLLVMGVYPFALAFRAAAFEARRAGREEWLSAARARGVPEAALRRRHLGAAVLSQLQAELPLIIGGMIGSLFIVEYQFGLPGIARFLFSTAFSGARPGMFYFYQYNLGLFVLLGLVAISMVVQALLRLSLRLAGRALTGE